MNVLRHILLLTFVCASTFLSFPTQANDAAPDAGVVAYEDFGAVGDGVHDDLPAIVRTHEHANANDMAVASNPDATYHLGRTALTAVIMTDTDWSTSRFIIDDTDVDDHKRTLFEVRSRLRPEKLTIQKLKRDQKHLDVTIDTDCYVTVTNKNIKRYIRRGNNQNSGTSQRDSFILHRDGRITGDIDWDYDKIDRAAAFPIDQARLFLRGGIFTTTANRMKQDVGYNYWQRNILITRSNTEVDGIVHHVVGETATGHPYSGFINVKECANVTLRNCFATAHKTYRTIGAAGKPVSMGSYDYSANGVVNFTMINCRMENITDRSRWGIIGTNYCKNIVLENCVLNRMDTHMGVSGRYEIRGCTLGYMGLNAIGRGLLTVENSTLHGRSLINFRDDYGSTWNGDIIIRDCQWIPNSGRKCDPHLFNLRNDGTHDFGYRCFMPHTIKINGLHVDDSNHSDAYEGIYLFSDPGGNSQSNAAFPYAWCQSIKIENLTATSGKPIRISPNPHLAESVEVTFIDAAK